MKNTATKPPIVRLQNVSKRFVKSLDLAAKIAPDRFSACHLNEKT